MYSIVYTVKNFCHVHIYYTSLQSLLKITAAINPDEGSSDYEGSSSDDEGSSSDSGCGTTETEQQFQLPPELHHTSCSSTNAPSTSDAVSNSNSRPVTLQSGSQQQSAKVTDIAVNKYDKPVQPITTFPSRVFGKGSRSFQKKWYDTYPWLEYSIQLDAAFCFPCRFFTNTPEPTFSTTGFRDWKHATGQKGILATHTIGKYHMQAMAAWKEYETRVSKDQSIGCQLDRMGSRVISENRRYVLTVMQAVLYCAQQGIALRGHDESADSMNPGNFRSLISLLARHTPELSRQLANFSSSASWLSPVFQNEIISFLFKQVYSAIKDEINKAKYFTVLADETKDISKEEQLSIAFCYIHQGKTIERFVGYTKATDLCAKSLAEYIKAKMEDLELSPEYLVSQCYHGASVMSGCNAGIQKFIKDMSPQAVYVHCCAHRLNLVLVDVAKSIREADDIICFSFCIKIS